MEPQRVKRNQMSIELEELAMLGAKERIEGIFQMIRVECPPLIIAEIRENFLPEADAIRRAVEAGDYDLCKGTEVKKMLDQAFDIYCNGPEL
jgi:hypothetical protein